MKNSAAATAQTGFDGGKLLKGRKRFVLVDTAGATVATCVLPTNAHDGQEALAWWAKLAHHPLLGQVQRVFINGGFRGEFAKKMAKLYQIEVTVPQEVVRQAGKFCVHATRWVVERSSSWITNNRGLATICPPSAACALTRSKWPVTPGYGRASPTASQASLRSCVNGGCAATRCGKTTAFMTRTTIQPIAWKKK